MKILLLSLLILIGMECALQADPEISFDDSASTDVTPVGAGYHLLNWNTFYFVKGANYPNTGYDAGTVSQPFAIYSLGGSTPSTISAGMFDFLGATMTAAWNDGLNVEIKGYYKGTLLYDEIHGLSAVTPITISFSYYGVDQVEFTSSGGTQHPGYATSGPEFVLDDVKVQTYLPYTPGLLVNGGFEDGNFSSWQLNGYTNETLLVTNSTYVHSGTYGTQLGPSNTNGFLGQDISPTQIGQLYNVSFWLKNTTNAFGSTTPNEFAVTWNGHSVFGLTNAGAFDWTNVSFNVPATVADEFLQFQFQQNPAYWGLDDVSVTPATLLSNGGFETGNFNGWGHFGNLVNDNVTGGAERVGTYGGQFGAVGSLSYVEQDIITQPGQPYLISAWLNNIWAGPQTNEFVALWNSQVLADNVNLPDAGWTNVHYTVLSGNTENTLFFGFRNDPSFFYFDEASVWPVPIVTNGGFEFGDFTGWTSSGNTGTFSIETTNVNSGYYAGQFGPTFTLGYLSQTAATVPGQAYLIRFNLNNFTGNNTNVEFSVSWDGRVLMDTTNVGQGWFLHQFVVPATAASTTLQFGFRDDPQYLGLDDVSVSPLTVPVFDSVTKSGTNIDLTWSEWPGYSYEVQYTTNLSKTNWTALQDYYFEPSVPMTTIDTNPPDPQRFYRVQMFPPPLF